MPQFFTMHFLQFFVQGTTYKYRHDGYLRDVNGIELVGLNPHEPQDVIVFLHTVLDHQLQCKIVWNVNSSPCGAKYEGAPLHLSDLNASAFFPAQSRIIIALVDRRGVPIFHDPIRATPATCPAMYVPNVTAGYKYVLTVRAVLAGIREVMQKPVPPKVWGKQSVAEKLDAVVQLSRRRGVKLGELDRLTTAVNIERLDVKKDSCAYASALMDAHARLDAVAYSLPPEAGSTTEFREPRAQQVQLIDLLGGRSMFQGLTVKDGAVVLHLA
ncbi:hypothetical protein DFH11DRAFT_1628626 [Phellopilus nigrolimitatus]|nr:hypothetical protein DFH11DRAFT_1628626 [Phellopilus nigrolimitatus]